jgi:hypothetical protein
MITAPIKGDITFEGTEGLQDLPAFPGNVPHPTTAWALTDQGPELLVTITVDGRTGTYRFLGDRRVEIAPAPEGGDTETARILWARLDNDDAAAITTWAFAAHARLPYALNKLTTAAATEGSEAYAVILAFATDDEVNTGYAKTAKERSLERAADAMRPYVTYGDEVEERAGRFVDILEDLMHAADDQGIDFEAQLESARRWYRESKADRGFAEDLL